MANTTAVYARIDTALKNNAEAILAKLGVSPASAIQMFYSQIVMHNGIPFRIQITDASSAEDDLKHGQQDAEKQKA